MKSNVLKIKKSLTKFIALFMSMILIMVLVPVTSYAENLVFLELYICLNDTSDIDVLGDFIAINEETGDTYNFVRNGKTSNFNSVGFSISVPVGKYRCIAVNEDVAFERTINLVPDNANDISLGGMLFYRMVSAHVYDGDELIDTQYVIMLNGLEAPEIPEKEGFKFDKWVTEDGETRFWFIGDAQKEGIDEDWFTPATKDMKVYATWIDLSKHDVLLDVTINGSKPVTGLKKVSDALGNFTLVNVEDTSEVYPLTLGEGLIYTARVPNGEYQVLQNGEIFENYTENIIVNDEDASKTIDFNSFHYYIENYNEFETVYVESGTTVTETSSVPQKEGYIFKGWFCEPQLINKYDFNSIITSRTLVYAGFEKEPEPIELHDLGFDLSLEGTDRVEDIGKFIAVNVDTGEVYEFEEKERVPLFVRMLTAVPDGKYQIIASNDAVVSNEEVIYKFPTMGNLGIITKQDFFILNMYDGTELLDTQYVLSGLQGRESEPPVKEGFRFVKWVKEDGYTEYEFDAVTASVDIYAVWEPIMEYEATVNITINGENPTENIQKIANELGDFSLVNVNDPTQEYILTKNEDLSYSTLLKNGEYKVLWNGRPLKTHNENIMINDSEDSITIAFNIIHYMDDEMEIDHCYNENNTTTEYLKVYYKDGYGFTGWFSERELINLFKFGVTVITEETFIYAGLEELEPETTEPETTEPETTEPETMEPETTEPETTEPETTEPETTEPETTEPETTEPETTEPETTEPETTEPETTEPETTEPETTEPETTEPETTEPETTEPETTEPETTEPETTEPETTEPETTESETTEPETTEPETTEPETTEPETIEPETMEPAAEETPRPMPPMEEEGEVEPPKTGDTMPVVIYATLGMIAGASYLLAYFYNNLGMSEDKKKEIVSRIIQWAKNKNIVVKWFAIMLIAIILVYYHAIGKKIDTDMSQVKELTGNI